MRIWIDENDYDMGVCVVALGMFDGVHVGHQKLIYRAKELANEMSASCVVYTFSQHPISLLNPEKEPMQLLSVMEKVAKFREMGVDGVMLRPFTQEFAQIEPLEYLRTLVEKMHVRGIVAGFNYTFGAGGRGDAAMIEEYAGKLGYHAEIIKRVEVDHEVVSSTMIRGLVKHGNLERAKKLLELQPE